MKVTVLWAGGWDDYEIDPTTLRDITEAEEEDYLTAVTAGRGGDPLLSNGAWLRLSFLGSNITRAITNNPKGKAVKIVKHLGGGD